jgi:hypothetical protein
MRRIALLPSLVATARNKRFAHLAQALPHLNGAVGPGLALPSGLTRHFRPGDAFIRLASLLVSYKDASKLSGVGKNAVLGLIRPAEVAA